jgi:hypothetical protein
MMNPFVLLRFLAQKLSSVEKIVADEVKLLYKATGGCETNLSHLKILDLGSSDGRIWKSGSLYPVLKNISAEITLLDATEELFDLNSTSTESRIQHRVGVLPDCLRQYDDNHFDLIVAIDLIEHLTKSDGFKLLYEIDRLSKHSSIIVTPNGFVWQPPAVNNWYNAHISSWTVKELSTLGWTDITGLIGLKHFWGPYSLPKKKPSNTLMWEFFALQKIIVRFIPKLSFSFLAIKRSKNPRNSIQE